MVERQCVFVCVAYYTRCFVPLLVPYFSSFFPNLEIYNRPLPPPPSPPPFKVFAKFP